MFVKINKAYFKFVLLVTIIKESHCECRQTYLTLCDRLEDIKNQEGVATWTELVVGSENVNASTLTTYNLHSIIPFRRLTSLTIIGQLNRITPLVGRCSFKYDLQQLRFYKNDIKTLEEYSIPALKLQKLSLTDNNIEHVERFIATDAQIEVLDLSNNKIEVIEDLVFVSYKGPIVTKTLIIKNNKISYMQDNSLPKSLETLNLEGNKLRFVQNEIMKNLPDLRTLILSHNYLYAVPSLTELKELRRLDLSYNSISAIGETTFRNLTRLYFIDLSNNKIVSASLADFWLRTNKEDGLLLSLGFNELKGFNMENVTGSFEHTLELFLYGNPFECAEFNKIQESMKALKISQNYCDKRFQSEGKTPYCLNYNIIFYKDVSKTVNDFLALIQKNKKLISCQIAPLDSVGYAGVQCVA